MASTTPSKARLEARIDTDLYELAKRAAEAQFTSLTDFVAAAIREKAIRTFKDARIIELALEDQLLFTHTLISPPKPSPALKRAFDSKRGLLGSS